MEQAEIQKIAIGAGLLALLVALISGRLPRWLRIVLVLAVVVLVAGAGLYAYRTFTQPTTLTVAAGSIDGDAPKILTALAARMAASNAPVRLKVVDKPTTVDAAKAFAAGEVDLAVARPDVGDMSSAKTVVVITRGVVLLIAPPGRSIADMDGLKGKTVGVVGGGVNHKVVEALTKGYDLDRAKVRFKDLALPDVGQALKSRQVDVLLVVAPISEKYLAILRGLFPKTAKATPSLIEIDAAGAIAAETKYYESYDLPKGTLRGAPPIPDDDLTTLRVPVYLVANKKLSDDVVGSLAKAVMEARRDLIAEYPVLASVGQPDTDKDSDKDGYIPIHPGASAYFDGDTKTIFDKYGDQFFYGSMLLGSVMSLFAGAWKFMTKKGDDVPVERALTQLYALADQIRTAGREAELAQAEARIDDILKAELEREAKDDDHPRDTAALALATHRLEYLIGQRRAALAAGPVHAVGGVTPLASREDARQHLVG